MGEILSTGSASTTGGHADPETPTPGEQGAVEALLGAGEAKDMVATASTDPTADVSAVVVGVVVADKRSDEGVDTAAGGGDGAGAFRPAVAKYSRPQAIRSTPLPLLLLLAFCTLLLLIFLASLLGRTERPGGGGSPRVLLYTGICFCRKDSSSWDEPA